MARNKIITQARLTSTTYVNRGSRRRAYLFGTVAMFGYVALSLDHPIGFRDTNHLASNFIMGSPNIFLLAATSNVKSCHQKTVIHAKAMANRGVGCLSFGTYNGSACHPVYIQTMIKPSMVSRRMSKE